MLEDNWGVTLARLAGGDRKSASEEVQCDVRGKGMSIPSGSIPSRNRSAQAWSACETRKIGKGRVTRLILN